MLGNTAYAIANKKITGVATGFDHALRTGDNTFSVFFIDGSKVDLTIPLPANGVNGTDGQDGQDGVSVTGYTLIDDTHLVWDFSDGTQSSQMEIPEQIVNISQESGNALVQKADGLFVGSTGVEVSSETDNAIEEKADGLYVKKTTDAAISQESGNALVKKEDGLYVGASAVEISEEEGNAIVEKADGLYVSDVSGVEIVETGETVSGDANFWVDENEDTEVVGTIATKEYCDSFIQAIKDITGDVADFTRADWTNLVQAVNYTYGAGAASFNYDNTDKKLVITTRSGQTVNVNLSSIITDTKIEELKDVNVNAVENGQLLGYHAASQTWKNVTINLSQVLNDAKDYTDIKFQAIEHADAIAVDEKPVDEGSKIVYVKDGVTKETTNYNTWFYYTADEKTVQTIFVDGMEFTLDVAGGVDFSDYVTQTQITSTMQDVDKTKVPNLTALYEVHTNVTSELGKKVDKSQGTSNAGKVLQVGSDGNVGLTDVDTLLQSVSYGENAGGENIFDEKWVIGDIDASGNIKSGNQLVSANKFKVTPNSTLKIIKPSYTLYFFKYGNDGSYLGYGSATSSVDTFSVPSNTYEVRIALSDNYGVVYNNDISIFEYEEGKTYSYVPYIKSAKQLTNEVDGINSSLHDLEFLGWEVPSECPIQNYVDANGNFHQRVGRVLLSDLTWEYDSSLPRFYTSGINTIAKKATSTNQKANINCYKYQNVSESNLTSTDKTISIGTSGGLYIHDTSYTDATAFTNALKSSNVYLYYELATENVIKVGSENESNNKLIGTNFVKLTVDTDYTCPCDGYFRINVGGTAGTVTGLISNYGVFVVTQVNNTSAVFVRKGTVIKYTSTTGTGFSHFLPLE